MNKWTKGRQNWKTGSMESKLGGGCKKNPGKLELNGIELDYQKTGDVGAEERSKSTSWSSALTFIAELVIQDVRFHFNLQSIMNPSQFQLSTPLSCFRCDSISVFNAWKQSKFKPMNIGSKKKKVTAIFGRINIGIEFDCFHLLIHRNASEIWRGWNLLKQLKLNFWMVTQVNWKTAFKMPKDA